MPLLAESCILLLVKDPTIPVELEIPVIDAVPFTLPFSVISSTFHLKSCNFPPLTAKLQFPEIIEPAGGDNLNCEIALGGGCIISEGKTNVWPVYPLALNDPTLLALILCAAAQFENH